MADQSGQSTLHIKGIKRKKKKRTCIVYKIFLVREEKSQCGAAPNATWGECERNTLCF